MARKYHLSFITGILIPVVYLVFTFLAYLAYPLPYSPLANWLSDLGSPVLNPQGAIFYNTGIILTAILLVVYFLGLSIWRMADLRIQVIMLRLAQIFGISGSICMALSALFPISQFALHSFWSTSLYILLSTAFIFTAAMLRYHPRIPRWLLVLGVSSAVLVILTAVMPTVYLLEWITIFVFLVYVCLLGLLSRKQPDISPIAS
jgi:hypothetical membrane protein